MDEARVAAAVRAIRLRKGWRQEDLAARAGVSRATVARIEGGSCGRVRLDATGRVVSALGARADLTIRWHGGDLDRLLDSRHAAMHEAMALRFRRLEGWTAVPEVSYSIYGERGIIDVLAWHPASRCVLVIELKTLLVDVSSLIGVSDRRARLATRIARERGWDARQAGTWIVLAESMTNRRRVEAHGGVLRSAFPDGPMEVRAWLRQPVGPLAALTFLSYAHLPNARQGLLRFRRPKPPHTLAKTSARGSPAAGGAPMTSDGPSAATEPVTQAPPVDV